MPYQNSFITIKSKLFQENSSSALQQSINWFRFIKWDWQYYSRERSNIQEKPTVGLPEVSRLINSAMSKRQGNQMKHSFLEKKYCIKRENGFTMNNQKYRISWWIVLWRNRFINFTIFFFHISKYLACNAEKALQLKIAKKERI